MADYIYLLQTRLTPPQLSALEKVRDVVRTHGMTVFLVGGAVRDLTAGFGVRDLDFAIQGDALKLKKDLQKAGFTVTGEQGTSHTLYLSYPGGVRLEVCSSMAVSYPKPGKPVYTMATIHEDLRRRDFTANAMAISLNEGSFGLLMDPLNGIADIENMELRLVSNYGFIENPALLIRAARLSARLGWRLEEKTQQRYETGKAEDYIAALTPWDRGYELEEIVHEEDPIRILRRLETEGWMKVLFPAWSAAKANEGELNRLRDIMGQLQGAGIHPDPSAAYFPLLTAKLSAKEVAELKKAFARPGFVAEIEALEGQTKEFGAQFAGKGAATPSAAWKMLYAAVPEQVLWLAYSSRAAAVQQRFRSFFGEWPQARNRIPYQTMLEMRITPELPIYGELVETLFFAMMDAALETPEALKAFLEPHSPPAPPPPPTLRRRPVKREAKAPRPKKAAKQAAAVETIAAEAEQPVAEVAAKVAPVAAKATEKKTVSAKAAAPAKAAAKKAAPAAKKVAVPAKKAVAPGKAAVAKKGAPATKKATPKAVTKTVAPNKAAPAAKKASAAKKAVPPAKKPAPPAKKAAPAKKSAGKAAGKGAAKKAPAKPAPKKTVAKKTSAKAARKPARKR